MYIPENSPIGSTVGELYAKDPDEGPNAIVQYSIIGNLKIYYILLCLLKYLFLLYRASLYTIYL